MERLIKGDIVVVPFPFSNLSASKRRPAMVLANLEGNDVILCQITSQLIRDIHAIILTDSDFITGSLHKTSNIRPNRIFNADKNIIIKKTGTVSPEKLALVVEKLCEIIQ